VNHLRDCERVTGEDLKRVAFRLYGKLEHDEAQRISLVRIPISDEAPDPGAVEAGGNELDDMPDGLWILIAVALIVAAALVLSI
jgi:hypothetical protein